MPNVFNSNTFSSTYFDDFRDSDHYHQILFNDGKALQARELTQLQTILNKDIKRFGDNIFREGATVKPGGITLDTSAEFVKLNTTSGATPDSTYVFASITGASSGIQGTILEVVAADGSDPATLYVRYDDLAGGTQLRFTPGETLTVTGKDDVVVQTVNTTANQAIGRGLKAYLSEGIFYVKGRFVLAENQFTFIRKYNHEAIETLVLRIVEDIVTVSDDTGLYDNSGGTANLSAPGADRYRLRLTLDILSNLDSDTNHLQLARITGQELTATNNNDLSYNYPNELVAKRIYENSGDYLVTPFKLNYDLDSASTTNLSANISRGTAVLHGYRYNRQYPTKLRVDRAQDTQEITDETISTGYGNYVKVATAGANDGLPEYFKEYILYSSTEGTGTALGYAKVRQVLNATTYYKFFLFDIDLNSGANFRSVQSIADTTGNIHFDILQENGVSVLYEPNLNNVMFDLPYIRPSTISDISFTYQKRDEATAATGQLTYTVDDPTNEVFINSDQWIFARNGLEFDTFNIASGGDNDTSVTIDEIGGVSLTNGQVYHLIYYVRRSNGTVKTKSITTSTVSGIASHTDSDGNTFYSLGVPDIYSLDSVRIADANGIAIDNRLTLDDGQRDNFYDTGRLILKSNFSAPGTVYAKFKHFEHGSTGQFFARGSYQGQVAYSNIPFYSKNDGEKVFLADVLDFRSVKDEPSDGAPGRFDTGTNARIHYLPKPTDVVTADVTYYLPRKDKLIINKDGILQFVKGLSSFDPSYPPTPEETLDLYRIEYNPFTLHDSDMTTEIVEHRRYTMKDIGLLDKRIDKLEELSTLTLLETAVSNLTVLDSAGNLRTKSGFLVDDFEDFTFCDNSLPTYRAAIDPQRKILRPKFNTDNIRLIYDSDLSSNVLRKGSSVFIDYDNIGLEQNLLATTTSNINPHNVIISIGNVFLSPSSDEWYEKDYNDTPTITQGGTRLKKENGQLWNDWQWNWKGTSIEDLQIGSTSNTSQGKNTRKSGNYKYTDTTTSYVKVVSEETVLEKIGERLVETAYIPFMRSVLINFKTEFMRPNSKMFAYFDGVDVSNWVRQYSSFEYYGENSNDFGNLYNSATSYPFDGGSSDLVTDATGSLIGKFFVPATRGTQRFRTGTLEFKLLDVTGGVDDNAVSRSYGAFTSTGVLNTYEKDLIAYRDLTVSHVSNTSTTKTRINNDKDDNFTGSKISGTNVYHGDISNSSYQKMKDRAPAGLYDPIAQSFFVQSYVGNYLTKVDIFFQSKPGGGDIQTPVKLQIRPLVNGYPASNQWFPGSEVVLPPSSVNIPADLEDMATISATPTTFTFEEPIFLEGRKDYAIVLITNCDLYNVYVAKTEEFVVGTTDQRVTKQPTLGSFFTSQNSRTWTAAAVQDTDMMFKLYNAEFKHTDATVVLRNSDLYTRLLPNDPIEIFTPDSDGSGNQNVRVYAPNHGLDVGDTVDLSGVTTQDSDNFAAVTLAGISGALLLNQHSVTAIDGNYYEFKVAKAAADSDGIGGGDKLTTTHNVMFTQYWPDINTFLPQGCTVTAETRTTTGKSLAGSETSMSKPTTYTTAFINNNNLLDAPALIANRATEIAELTDPVAGDKSFDIRLNLSTGGSLGAAPVLDLERASVSVIGNVIDKQDSAATSGFNVPIVYVNETDPFEGTALSKHITIPALLQEDAVGLNILVSANRPSAADFLIYARTGQSDESIYSKPFVLIDEDTNNPPDENPTVFREYRYLWGGLNGTLEPFSQYQVKIVMRSTNAAKVPVIKDLRVIALSD